MMNTFVHWNWPDDWTLEQRRKYIIERDWDDHDAYIVSRERYEANLAHDWLTGADEMDCAEAKYHYSHLDSFQPKPSRDIRAEKTREWRKRKPKAPKINPVLAVNASIIYCLLGVSS